MTHKRKNASAANAIPTAPSDAPTTKSRGRPGKFSKEARNWVEGFHSQYDNMVAGLNRRSDEIKEWEDARWVEFNTMFEHELKDEPSGSRTWKVVSGLLHFLIYVLFLLAY